MSKLLEIKQQHLCESRFMKRPETGRVELQKGRCECEKWDNFKAVFWGTKEAKLVITNCRNSHLYIYFKKMSFPVICHVTCKVNNRIFTRLPVS